MVFRIIFFVLVFGLPFGAAAGPRGPVTNLPMPRFVSMKADEGNVRRGPSLTHRIDWVFKHEDMPLQITAEFGHWRRVLDSDGQGGWMHYSLLSGVRTVVVQEKQVKMRMKPSEVAATRALADRGVIARLGDCGLQWCELRVDGVKGWVEKASLWGVADQEIRE